MRRLLHYLDGGEHRALALFAVCIVGLVGSLVLLKRHMPEAALAVAAPTAVAWLVLLAYSVTRRSHPSDDGGAGTGRDSHMARRGG